MITKKATWQKFEEYTDTVKEKSLLNLLRKLYDQQFPERRSCFELLAIQRQMEVTKKINHVLNGWFIFFSFVSLVATSFYSNSNSSVYPSVLWGGVLFLLVAILAFITHFFYYSPKMTAFERDLSMGDFNHYKEMEELFLTLSQRCGWYDLRTPNDLAQYFEERVRFSVLLMKSSQAYPDYEENKTDAFLKSENDLFEKFLRLICMLRMMNVEKADNTTPTSFCNDLFEKRAKWLRKKLFDEVTI